jgi:hypothetical protein
MTQLRHHPDLLADGAAATVRPLTARAQQPGKLPTIRAGHDLKPTTARRFNQKTV